MVILLGRLCLSCFFRFECELRASNVPSKSLPHIQHSSFTFKRRLAQRLARLWQLIRMLLQAFRGEFPFFDDTVRVHQAIFESGQEALARRGHWSTTTRLRQARGIMFPSLTPTIAPVPFRSFLSVFGSQASEFLHGILATSVQEPRRPAFSTVLNAQGRVLYDVFLHTQKDEKGKPGYIIEYDSRASEAPPLYDLLKRYVLRSKVKIRDVSQEYDAWAAWGSPEHSHWETQRKWHWEHSGAMEPIWPAESEWPWGLEDGIIRDRRAPGMGSRILVRKGDRPKESLSHDIQTSDAYTLLRILKGVPEGLVDIPPLHAFPMDSNLDIMGGLDFRKGCYVGQELTVRTYHTGVIRKRVLPVVIREHQMSSPVAQSLPSGLDIRPITRKESQNKSPHPRGSSKLLTSLHGHGLVLFRLEHLKNGNLTEEEPQQFALQTDGSATWIVEPQWPQWWDWCRRSGVL